MANVRDTGGVTPLPAYVSIAECSNVYGVAVVIDVLRAFSTAAWAFELGAERIVLTDDLDEALKLKASIPGALALKDGHPQPGFDLTNSPVMIKSHDLRGATIVQRTQHGTAGAVAARGAERLYCASFGVASATADAVRESGFRDVYFVITGDDGTADEDLACAEYIAALLDDPSTDVAPFLARVAKSAGAVLDRQRIEEGHAGFADGDIEACMEADRFGFAMRAREEAGLLVLRRL
jgi:2-phosphosulfolactate phosphatase